MTDLLQDLLNSQSELQTKMPTDHPLALYGAFIGAEHIGHQEDEAAELTTFLKDNVYALEDELHELLGETGWKPWATKRFVNLEAARGEAIDALHFILNIFLALGLDDSREISRRYHAKHAKNVARQEAGYDGVSTKCPGCHRALDDDAVDCYAFKGRLGTEVLEDLVFCATSGRAYRL